MLLCYITSSFLECSSRKKVPKKVEGLVHFHTRHFLVDGVGGNFVDLLEKMCLAEDEDDDDDADLSREDSKFRSAL